MNKPYISATSLENKGLLLHVSCKLACVKKNPTNVLNDLAVWGGAVINELQWSLLPWESVLQVTILSNRFLFTAIWRYVRRLYK